MPGRVNVDLFLVIKDQYKLGSYKLNDVAMNFLGVGKVKMDFEDKALFKNWDKDDEARFQNVYYCAIDTDRTDELAYVLNLLQNCVIMMSNVTLTSMFDVVTRGQ
jgi:DNA polymerase elongation subunit (family B)